MFKRFSVAVVVSQSDLTAVALTWRKVAIDKEILSNLRLSFNAGLSPQMIREKEIENATKDDKVRSFGSLKPLGDNIRRSGRSQVHSHRNEHGND
jgi:hypothetical protein